MSLLAALRFVALAIFGIAGALLPVSAAIREARTPRDRERLDIDADYRRDDRYFARSLAAKLTAALGPRPRAAGVREVQLRQTEIVRTVDGPFDVTGAFAEDLLDVEGDVCVAANVVALKEICASGSATVGNGARVRALKADGDVALGASVIIERWVDAGRSLTAARETDLGARATASDAIDVAERCSFRLLAAPVIRVGGSKPAPRAASDLPRVGVHEFADDARSRNRPDGVLLVDGDFVLPRGARASGDVIATGDVVVENGVDLQGSIHADGSIIVGRHASIRGSLFAEERLEIGDDAFVEQHAIARARGCLGARCVIGTPGEISTLLAGGEFELSPGVVVYGRIVADRGGRT